MQRGRPTKGVAAVNRALAVLDSFSAGAKSLTLGEIAARTHLHKSTILRLIDSLRNFGCLIQLADGSYRLGPTLFHLGYLYHHSFQIEDHVMPALRHLARETEESASFYIREGDKRICLFRVDSPRSLRDHVQVGDIMPLARAGATGRVLLAFSRKAPSNVKLPISTVGALSSETAGLSIPIFGRDDTLLGALTLSGPKTRFTKPAIKTMSIKLLKTGGDLTRDLGGDPRRVRGSAPVGMEKRARPAGANLKLA
jgi:DNA-binding IclR family transcriptional regulator